jgi:protein-S-isoprenylcysteine O-methyltransferase Ste14
MQVRLILFFVISILLVGVSLRALKARHSHGFTRFFAWEALSGLILLNLPGWFLNPFSPLQILSWLVLVGSIYMAMQGFRLLKRVGKPQNSVKDNETARTNFEFENTTNLVTVGVYQYIRHPLYSSLLLLAIGAFLKDVSVFSCALLVVCAGCLVLTARIEERENLAHFGDSYSDYMKRTRMFIPYVF